MENYGDENKKFRDKNKPYRITSIIDSIISLKKMNRQSALKNLSHRNPAGKYITSATLRIFSSTGSSAFILFLYLLRRFLVP